MTITLTLTLTRPVVVNAFALAEELHRGQRRRGTDIKYLSHLLAVAAHVLEDGGRDVEVAAALLHDAAEDQGGEPTLRRIAQECGGSVAAIVRECSDASAAERDDQLPWQERKQAFLASLPTKSEEALLVIAAGKYHNAQATFLDLKTAGSSVWKRFHCTPAQWLWYHQAMAVRLGQLLPNSRSVDGLRLIVEQLRQPGWMGPVRSLAS